MNILIVIVIIISICLIYMYCNNLLSDYSLSDYQPNVFLYDTDDNNNTVDLLRDYKQLHHNYQYDTNVIDLFYNASPQPIQSLHRHYYDIPNNTNNNNTSQIIDTLTSHIVNKFNISDEYTDDLYRHIYSYMNGNQTNYTFPSEQQQLLLMYTIYTTCKLDEISHLKIGEYLIWKLPDMDSIDYIYNDIIHMAEHNDNNLVRANAIDILIRSNNKRYLDISKRLLQQLRQDERQEIDRNDLNDIHIMRNRLNNVLTHGNNNLPRGNTKNNQLEHIDINNEDLAMQAVLLAQLQVLNREEVIINLNNTKDATVYTDTQNVHNHKINNSVIESAVKFIESSDRTSSHQVSNDYIEQIRGDLNKLHADVTFPTIINRIQTDPSKFKNNMTISMVFDRLLKHIYSSKHKDELIHRLAQEMKEMNGICATGVMSRLMNVMQGFDDTPMDASIQIDPKDEIYATITAYLNKSIQDDDNADQLLEDMSSTGENKKRYIHFVGTKMREKVALLEVDYMNIVDKTILYQHIENGLAKYMKDNEGTKNVMNMIVNK